jgi:small multidrug resistance family-3 protein
MQILLLVVAAVLEVGGDAMIRHGLKSHGIAAMAGGGLVLVAYGFMVNMTKLDFGKLMGIYIVLFFIVSQVSAVVIFKERLALPVIVGGGLIIAGAVVMMVLR